MSNGASKESNKLPSSSPTEDLQEKQFLTAPIELKSFEKKQEDQGEFGYFEGYASTFGNMDRVDDIMMHGCFEDSIRKYQDTSKKLPMLWQHRMDVPIGSFPVIREDVKGLFVQGRINLGVEQGRSAYALLKAGDLDSMSIGFITRKSDYDEETQIRRIKEVDLMEVSVVTIPANSQATLTSIKSIIESAYSIKKIETLLRQKGFSQTEATTLVARVKSLHEMHKAAQEEKHKQAQTENEVGSDSPTEDITAEIAELTSAVNLLKTNVGV
jgi:HK97 family phage prohead protease